MQRLHLSEVAGLPTALHRRPGAATPALAVRSLVLGGLVMFAPSVARADHDMAMHGDPDTTELSLGLSLEAAEFNNGPYIGSYQGVTPSVGWRHGRFGAHAALGLYHLYKNGLDLYGRGDTALVGHAVVVATDAVQAGVALHVMLPTGSELDGLGMGHMMAMPSVWASWHAHPFVLAASAGYGRALSGIDGTHVHGLMPLVDPMNMDELTWSAGAEVMIGHGVRVGGRAAGGVPIGTGFMRAFGAGRVAWDTQHMTTAVELQLGLAGDPFTLRGVVDTALRF